MDDHLRHWSPMVAEGHALAFGPQKGADPVPNARPSRSTE